ncbi:hypothetical protein NQ317_012006 [Molorchus minor]|uniref:Uncharacterized protein n=1 Tax=Molorchus minor TaxID=1323400 RepID=A0ABQ9JYS4_9CUCU|nr:hypothetical protein NQ317_012006 [Molorchus minor]
MTDSRWAAGSGQRAKALAAVAGSVGAWHPCKAQCGSASSQQCLPWLLTQRVLQPEPLYAQVNMEKKRNRQPSLGNASLNHLTDAQTQPKGQPPPLTSLPAGKDSWV